MRMATNDTVNDIDTQAAPGDQATPADHGARPGRLETIAVKNIRTDGGTQARSFLRESVVGDFAEEMRRGDKFPAVVVFHGGANYWLADGFHRVEAARPAVSLYEQYEQLKLIEQLHVTAL